MSELGNSRLPLSSWVPEEPGADIVRLRNSSAVGDTLVGEAVAPLLTLGMSAHGEEHDAEISEPAGLLHT